MKKLLSFFLALLLALSALLGAGISVKAGKNFSLSASVSSVSVKPGGEATVLITAVGDHNIKVQSSDRTIATASFAGNNFTDNSIKINIKGIREGTCIIRLVMSNNTSVYVDIEVTVSKSGSSKEKVKKPTPPKADFTGFANKKNGKTYYFKNGEPQTGFVKYEGDTYYFDPQKYTMKKGWVTDSNKRYYFYDDGKMAVGTTEYIDGKECEFDSRGVYQGLNTDEQEFVDTICPYMLQFKDPSSVKIIGTAVYKFDDLLYNFYSSDLKGPYQAKISGYIFQVSATNSFGARGSDYYILVTKDKGNEHIRSTTKDMLKREGTGLTELDGLSNAYDSWSNTFMGTNYRSTHDPSYRKKFKKINIDNAMINKELRDKLELYGY